MKTTKNQRITLLIALTVVTTISCTKEIQRDDFSWNAVAFTESTDPKFSSYMNEPYINITYPSSVKSDAISFVNGKWSLSGFDYIFSAHNWGEEKIIISLIRDGETLITSEISPQPSTSLNGIKHFSFSHDTPPGKYTIEISLHDHRGITKLNKHPLHSGQDYFIIE